MVARAAGAAAAAKGGLKLSGVGQFALNALYLYFIVAVRYLLVAGLAYYLCYVRGRERLQSRKIISSFQPGTQLKAEILWSCLASVFFALAGAVIYWGWEQGYVVLYQDPAAYGYLYLFFSLPLLMFLHDTYFYWMHRLLHLKIFFHRIHGVHHASRDPSPFASFSFHPAEAFLEAIILPVLAFVLPIHLAVLGIFLLVMTVLGVVNHLGYELFPRGFVRWPLFHHLITATNHHQHHQTVRWNYGLYFTCWDRWMGTHHPEYEKIYESSAATRPAR